MKIKSTLLLLKLIKNYILDKEDKFAKEHHFVDKKGKSLPIKASSIPHAAKRCIGGAVIEGLVVLGMDENASADSPGYKIAMYNLGDALGPFNSGKAKIRAVMKVNNEGGFAATHEMIDKAIAQCEGILGLSK